MQSSLDAEALFLRAMACLRDQYDSFEFWTERDLVWTIQTHLRRTVQQQGLACSVLNDYPMLPGPRRSRSADLVIRGAEGTVMLAVEFKYEPDHRRADLLPQKLPVVLWGHEGVAKDIERIREFVHTGTTPVAYAILVDEGGCFRHRQPPDGSLWEDWPSRMPGRRPVSLLWTRWPPKAGGLAGSVT